MADASRGFSDGAVVRHSQPMSANPRSRETAIAVFSSLESRGADATFLYFSTPLASDPHCAVRSTPTPWLAGGGTRRRRSHSAPLRRGRRGSSALRLGEQANACDDVLRALVKGVNSTRRKSASACSCCATNLQLATTTLNVPATPNSAGVQIRSLSLRSRPRRWCSGHHRV